MIPAPLTRLAIAPNSTLVQVLQSFGPNQQSEIHWLVQLLENPKSPLALPGNVDLFGHDCLHILLDLSITPADEAFVIGFTMGNDPKTNGVHLWIFKLFARFLYPAKYRFTLAELQMFDRGAAWGRQLTTRNVHQFDFHTVLDTTVARVRSQLGINMDELEEFIEADLSPSCEDEAFVPSPMGG